MFAFDNVLFKGEVPNIWARDTNREPIVNNDLLKPSSATYDFFRKRAKYMHEFNALIRKERRVEQVLLPFGDGLTIARRIG